MASRLVRLGRWGMLSVAAAAWLAPDVLGWLTPGGAVDRALIALGLPTATRGVPPTVGHLLPIYAVSAPAAIMSMHLMRGYAPLLAQTRARVLAACAVSAFAGVSASVAAAPCSWPVRVPSRARTS